MKKINILFLIFISITIQQAFTQDTLYLYTRHDCQVCIQTKQVLSTRSVKYIDYDLSDNWKASEMLNKLSNSNYMGSIHLPVIYLGRKLLHPAYETESVLKVIDINSVMDSIILKQQTGKIANVFSQNENTSKSGLSISTDCTHNAKIIYLIVASYSSKKAAADAVEILIKYGYPNAGYLEEKQAYRVYTDYYSSYELATEQIKEQKIRFTDAYLMQKSE